VRVEVIPADELTQELMAKWRQIQQSDATFSSPYFCPEFAFAAGQIYPDTFVGVIEESNEVVGFMPFERYSRRAGQGVAESRADYQGVIIDPRVERNAEELLKGCGLSSLEFGHLIVSQQPLRRYHRQVVKSHVINLCIGGKYNPGSHGNHRLREKARQAAREVGPLRMVYRRITACLSPFSTSV